MGRQKRTPIEIQDEISKINLKAVVLGDDMYQAIIGINHKKKVLIYDYQKMLDVWITRDKMTREEAVEWFDYNVSYLFNGKENYPQLRNL